MDKNKKIIIITHGRSGSTSLLLSLNQHPKINIINEPFNSEHQHKNKQHLIPKIKNIKDIESLEWYLKEIYKDYNGLKTLFHHLQENLYKYLLSKVDYKVIFLTRKNLLKAAVSENLSRETRIWNPRGENLKEYNEEIKEMKFKNMDIISLKKIINYNKNKINLYRRFLEQNNIPFFNLYHEDLFDYRLKSNNQIKMINNIIKFIGLDIISDSKILKKTKDILDYNKNKINDEEVYKKIPNIGFVEEKLGNNENGFLFKFSSDQRDVDNKLNDLKSRLISIKNKIDNG
ncbi:MAG: hypothetical protein ABIH37_02830 [archaeon]